MPEAIEDLDINAVPSRDEKMKQSIPFRTESHQGMTILLWSYLRQTLE
jgi:hypothetical protein